MVADAMNDFELPQAKNDSTRQMLSDVAEFGWHWIGILEDEKGPQYAFSVGLFYSYGHPEIVIMGLEHSVASTILRDLAIQIKAGQVYRDGSIETDLISLPVQFRKVPSEFNKEYFGSGRWFYQNLPDPFPVLQMVWPDKDGLFPWVEGHDERFLDKQKPLYADSTTE